MHIIGPLSLAFGCRLFVEAFSFRSARVCRIEPMASLVAMYHLGSIHFDACQEHSSGVLAFVHCHFWKANHTCESTGRAGDLLNAA